MKPLGTVDTSFLLAEDRQMPMHTGGLMLFRYPEGVHEEWLHETLSSNDDPDAVQYPFNQKVVWPLRRFGLPHWVTDRHLTITYDIRLSRSRGAFVRCFDWSPACTRRDCIAIGRCGKRISSKAWRVTGSRST
jgi:hypothetical protein